MMLEEIDYNQLYKNTCEGLDFFMDQFDHVNGLKLPRTIMTAATIQSEIGQVSVDSRDRIMLYYRAALFEDCRINAYPDFERMKQEGLLPQNYKPKPNHLMIDIDRVSFSTDEELEIAFKETLANIERYISGLTIPIIVVWSGNGYHIHVLLEFEKAFEDMADYACFKNPSVKFMRWAARKLSNGKSDHNFNPTFNSCLFRVPGTINSKAKEAGKDPIVKEVQPSSPHIITDRGKPKQEFLNDFNAYLVQEIIDEKIERRSLLERQRRRYRRQTYNNNNNNNNSRIPEYDKLLETGIGDNRKNIMFWILAPYLITVKGLDYDRAYNILESWLQKCDQVRRLSPSWAYFRSRIRYCLESARDGLRKPDKTETFREYYPEIYKRLFSGAGQDG
jgi:hypothetical protein